MVTKQLLSVVRRAIKDPENYSSGTEKNELRAAFDALISQVCKSVFKKEPATRMNARILLNGAKKGSRKTAEWEIIKLLRQTIKEAETSLFAAGYTEHEADIQAFIQNYLEPLYNKLNEK